MRNLIHRVCTAIITVYILAIPALAAEELIPVGEVIGLELSSGTVTVAGYDDACSLARDAGLRIGDTLISIDDRRITCAEDVRQALQTSDGSVDLLVNRNGKKLSVHMEPAITPDGPKLGVYLRQGVTGIGTVTFFDPESGLFGTLGHGVNTGDGDLLAMTEGRAFPAEIVSIQKGKAGSPGQLKGALDGNRITGILRKNTSRGVFGSAPAGWQGTALPVADWEDISPGSATIRCAVVGAAPRDYSVEILKIYSKDRSDSRNFLLRVTDPDLLAATGGIVQGMSGSPIIQNGKLVGAVTHVLVNDPQTGYGIFIENMLDAAS